eukprot:3494280-Pleurochrysis_carterae.AAC.3
MGRVQRVALSAAVDEGAPSPEAGRLVSVKEAEEAVEAATVRARFQAEAAIEAAVAEAIALERYHAAGDGDMSQRGLVRAMAEAESAQSALAQIALVAGQTALDTAHKARMEQALQRSRIAAEATRAATVEQLFAAELAEAEGHQASALMAAREQAEREQQAAVAAAVAAAVDAYRQVCGPKAGDDSGEVVETEEVDEMGAMGEMEGATKAKAETAAEASTSLPFMYTPRSPGIRLDREGIGTPASRAGGGAPSPGYELLSPVSTSGKYDFELRETEAARATAAEVGVLLQEAACAGAAASDAMAAAHAVVESIGFSIGEAVAAAVVEEEAAVAEEEAAVAAQAIDERSRGASGGGGGDDEDWQLVTNEVGTGVGTGEGGGRIAGAALAPSLLDEAVPPPVHAHAHPAEGPATDPFMMMTMMGHTPAQPSSSHYSDVELDAGAVSVNAGLAETETQGAGAFTADSVAMDLLGSGCNGSVSASSRPGETLALGHGHAGDFRVMEPTLVGFDDAFDVGSSAGGSLPSTPSAPLALPFDWSEFGLDSPVSESANAPADELAEITPTSPHEGVLFDLSGLDFANPPAEPSAEL